MKRKSITYCNKFVIIICVAVLALFSCKKDPVIAPQPLTSTVKPSESLDQATASAASETETINEETSGPNLRVDAVTVLATLNYSPSNAITYNGASNITISGKSIQGGTAAAITLNNCHDVIITNCKLYNSTNVGVYLYNCYNITIVGNFFTNVSTGVYADQSVKGGIIVNQNQFLNMVGPMPRGQFVQFNNINGANNQIRSNKCENIAGQSNSEDGISLYKCNGLITSPILISGNKMRGGGPSGSGGGIMLGDGGGSYQRANNNILVNPGQYGVAISGGTNNSLTNNSIYGISQSFTNVGLYVASYGAAILNPSVSGNNVKFYNSGGSLNGAWLGSGILSPLGWLTNNWNAGITAAILPTNLITYN